MGARGQDRLTESSGSSDDIEMKRVFETAECEVVTNSIFWELRYERHENQMKGAVETKVSDLQMNAWISACDTVKVPRCTSARYGG